MKSVSLSNVLASGIAKRGGRDWFPVGGGVDGRIFALIVFDDGTGAALYAGGNFTAAGEVDANSIAKWDGASWSALGGGLLQARRLVGTVFDLAVFDDGSGPAIFAGGDFNTAGTVTANSIAKWDGSSWSALDGGVAETFNKVFALAVFDDRTGSALYAGGFFREIGGIDARFIAKWDGSAWSTVGGGVGNRVGSLTVFNDETGPGLFAGGSFLTAGGVSANGIAKWNGRNWSALGSGVTVGSGVSALSGFEDETGPVLYAGGSFKTAGGTEANRIAKWDGSTWSALGSGMGAGFGFSTGVAALTSFDDGSRRVLYAGGRFRTAGGKPSSDIAAWRVPFDCNNNGIRDDCDSTCASPGRPCFDVAGCGESVDRNENGSPDECELLGDCDFDGLVSLRDGGMFADCVTGPGVAVDALDACRCDDLNGDGFVDLRDAAEFGSFFGSSR